MTCSRSGPRLTPDLAAATLPHAFALSWRFMNKVGPMRKFSVTTPDQLTIAASEWGNPAGQEILFLHGYMQSSMSWLRQLSDPVLADEFRMIAYDLRGHGASDKPLENERYAEGRLWADEAAAVIAAAHLQRPVLVGWSYSGRVISDYLRFHGQGSIAGINFVAAVTKSARSLPGPTTNSSPRRFRERSMRPEPSSALAF